MRLAFTVPGQVRSKARPRVVSQGGVAHAYTPAATRSYERHVRDCAGRAAAEHGRWESGGRMRVTIRIFCDARRRDIDNVAKAITDAMNGLIYEDDSQIDELHVHRVIERETPRAEVEVESWS